MKKQVLFILSALFVTTVLITSCHKPSSEDLIEQSSEPVLPAIADNYKASSNDQLAALGRVLFYDKKLSLNNTISCASCHQQEKAFCDNQKVSTGLEDFKTKRNSPSIFAREGRLFWDGRVNDFEELSLKPIKNHVEMKFENINELAKKISTINYYPNLFKKAFGTTQIDSIKIQSALAEFLINFNFSENRFRHSELKKAKLTASEEIGKTVFFGKGRCSNCHHIQDNGILPNDFGSGYGFTDQSFNIGLDEVYSDNGLGEITGNPADYGKFMIPVLLNVEYTAPYMHDGRFSTLEEVVEHYNSGIKNHPNLDMSLRGDFDFDRMSSEMIMIKFDVNGNGILDESEIQNITSSLQPVRLNLDENEKRCLVAFLKSLSDPTILSDQKFSNPFARK